MIFMPCRVSFRWRRGLPWPEVATPVRVFILSVFILSQDRLKLLIQGGLAGDDAAAGRNVFLGADLPFEGLVGHAVTHDQIYIRFRAAFFLFHAASSILHQIVFLEFGTSGFNISQSFQKFFLGDPAVRIGIDG